MAADLGQASEENGEFPLQVNCFSNTDPYEKKYFALLRRCEGIQQSNERLVNRIHHVQRMLRRLRHERRLLMKRLDQHGDDYLSIPLTFPAEEDPHSMDLYSAQYSPPATTLNETNLNLPHTSTSTLNATNLPKTTAPQKKKARVDKEKELKKPENSSNPFFMFSPTQNNNHPILETIKQEIKVDEFSQDDLNKTFSDTWTHSSEEQKGQLFYSPVHVKQEID